MKEKMFGRSLGEFAKDRSCLTRLIDFCTKMTTFADEEGAVDAIYLYFSQAFDTGVPGR